VVAQPHLEESAGNVPDHVVLRHRHVQYELLRLHPSLSSDYLLLWFQPIHIDNLGLTDFGGHTLVGRQQWQLDTSNILFRGLRGHRQFGRYDRQFGLAFDRNLSK